MSSVKFFAPDTDAFVDSIVRHADEFRAESGLDLELQIIPSNEYFSNQIHSYLEGDECADVFTSGQSCSASILGHCKKINIQAPKLFAMS